MDPAERPTKILSEEHQNILRLIDALVKECESLRSGKELDREFFGKAIDFIRNYADRFHHAKEEDILFVELCKDDVQMHCNPIPQMLHEHDVGRDFVKGMEAGVSESDSSKVMENALSYAQLLQEHIYKEDNILYVMAEEALDAKMKRSILKRFDQAEQKRFTKGSKERFLSIVEELEGKPKG